MTQSAPHRSMAWFLILAAAFALIGCDSQDPADPIPAPGDTVIPQDPPIPPSPEAVASLVTDVQGPIYALHCLDERSSIFHRPQTEVSLYREESLVQDWIIDHITIVYPTPIVASGDTLAVTYITTADSTGLDVLLAGDVPDEVRLITERHYIDVGAAEIVDLARELVLDAKGDMDPANDDVISIQRTTTRGNGEHTTTAYEHEDGSSAMLPLTRIRATRRIENPADAPLTAATEADILTVWTRPTSLSEMTFTHDARDGAQRVVHIEPYSTPWISPYVLITAETHYTAASDHPWIRSIHEISYFRTGQLNDPEDDITEAASRTVNYLATAADGGLARSLDRFQARGAFNPYHDSLALWADLSIHYPAGGELESLTRSNEYVDREEKHVVETRTYRDGTRLDRTADFEMDEWVIINGSVSDGTTQVGRYNLQFGNFGLTTTYPSGSTPLSKKLSYYSEIDDIGSIEVSWPDGHLDKTTFRLFFESQYPTPFHRLHHEHDTEYSIHADDDGVKRGFWTREDGVIGGLEIEAREFEMWSIHFRSTAPDSLGGLAIIGEITVEPGGTGVGRVRARLGNATSDFKLRLRIDGTAVLFGEDGTVTQL